MKQSVLDIPNDNIPKNYFDTVVCINVLEHINDDMEAVKAMLSVLRPGGKLFLYVPACNWVNGSLDRELGHYRRYSKQDLKKISYTVNGYIDQLFFVNLLGILGWFWAAKLRKDKAIRRENASLMDKLVPFLSAIERLIKPPIGQSLVLILVKSSTT